MSNFSARFGARWSLSKCVCVPFAGSHGSLRAARECAARTLRVRLAAQVAGKEQVARSLGAAGPHSPRTASASRMHRQHKCSYFALGGIKFVSVRCVRRHNGEAPSRPLPPLAAPTTRRKETSVTDDEPLAAPSTSFMLIELSHLLELLWRRASGFWLSRARACIC